MGNAFSCLPSAGKADDSSKADLERKQTPLKQTKVVSHAAKPAVPADAAPPPRPFPKRLRALPPCPPFFEATLETLRDLKLAQADARLETYLRSLVVALGTSGAWVALVEGREGVKLHSAVGPLCGVGEVHGWQNSLSLWTCSPATHRVLIIEDTTEDARVWDSVLVTQEPKIRFYAGAPLVASSGHRIGALAVLDKKPRALDVAATALLVNIAELCVRELENKWALSSPDCRLMLRPVAAYHAAVLMVDTHTPGWPILLATSAAAKSLGLSEHDVSSRFWELLEAATTSAQAHAQAVAAGLPFTLTGVRLRGQISPGFSVTFRPATEAVLDAHSLPVGIPATIARGPTPPALARFWMAHLAGGGGAPDAAVTGGALKPRSVPFLGLELGPPLAQGPSGRMYQATYRGQAVAVKIVADGRRCLRCTDGVPVEAKLSDDPSAPRSLLRTRAYAMPALPCLPPAHEVVFAKPQSRASVPASQTAAATSAATTPTFATGAAAATPDFTASADASDGRAAGAGAAAAGPKKPDAQVGAEPTQAAADRGKQAGAAAEPRNPGHNAGEEIEVGVPATSVGSAGGASIGSTVSAAAWPAASSDTGGVCLKRKSSLADSAHSFDGAIERQADRYAGEVWLIQELCTGGTLQDAVESGRFHNLDGSLDMPAMLATAQEIVEGMAYLHSKGIVHADLTATSVLLTPSEEDPRGFVAKLSGYGLRDLGTDIATRMEVCMYRTVAHLPPETLLKNEVTEASAMYAFGALLHRMAYGKRLHGELTWAQTVAAATYAPLRPTLPPGVRAPPALMALMGCCLQREPSQRPKFMEVASILDAIEEARRSRSSMDTSANEELAAGATAKFLKPDSAAANADFMGTLRLSEGAPATAPIGDPRDGLPESPDGNGHTTGRAPPMPDMPDWGTLRALHSASSDTLSLREGQRGSLRLLGTEVEQHTPRCVPPAEPFGGADAAQAAGPATEQETVVASQMAAAAKKLGALTDPGLTGLRCRTSLS